MSQLDKLWHFGLEGLEKVGIDEDSLAIGRGVQVFFDWREDHTAGNTRAAIYFHKRLDIGMRIIGNNLINCFGPKIDKQFKNLVACSNLINNIGINALPIIIAFEGKQTGSHNGAAKENCVV